MPTPVEQIKARLSIKDVVESYIKLTKAGGNYRALCPFHNEKTPSFNVSPSRDGYYCFGCNRGGDIFTFVQEIEGVDFIGALRILADRAGVELKRENIEAKSERERLLAVMEEATNFYEEHLEDNSAAKEYLIGRGLEAGTIRSFRIGYAPLDWRLLYEHLRAKKFLDGEIEKAGLTKKAEGKGYYDRFRGRIMFPIFDIGGRVVAFSGRVFGEQKTPDGSDVAKYINSPETSLYDKSATLFGYDRAKMAARKQNFAILVEGQMDLIMAHQAGTENTVAVSGTALTERHLALLKRLTDNLVFAFDADDAGLAATTRAFQIALSLGMSVRVAAIPEGKDPADYILKNKEGWSQVVADAKHIVDFYITALSAKGSDPRHFRKEVETKVLPLILAMQSKIEQAHFIVEVARKLGIPEAAVWDEVKRLSAVTSLLPPRSDPPAPDVARVPMRTRWQVAEEEIIAILLWQEGHKEPAFDVSELRTYYEKRMEEHGLTPHRPTEDDERILAIKAEHTYEHGPKLRESVEEMLDTLEQEVLKEKQAELMKKIVDAKLREAKEEETTLLREFQSITPRVIALEDRRLKRAQP
ncbi:MAG: DNA primase [Candidatus Lloydbacteria bacterium RIFCSPHIGHO2_02_FULL_54_17]|uniref:DNA primase n=1 Tax=Candidatus Lloydbacteria bacterium RIFCSPHIGHO2_02_FULL_54_17 TaxID=1798664 RepID=A0A1G2DG54_9BACT|nr:MAG: DNA primase [Candidatus Lloydbacteria bacterium RIFCSPHIGHO2_01_FULL_54_11]OGZ12644.1 MAG: DNA primase [Candidatus Lloydbacteria bacterium RIFCSPHIGHO2_02_FULL_54_17]OGZ13496.1 MAG: DNA primase [Candidatus Lloydbacteria bacterium RIFCSPLOWO2_01_FULL_54_18]